LDGAIHPNLGYLGAGHHHKALTNWHLNRLPSPRAQPFFPSPGSFIIEQPTSGRRYPKLLHCQNANTLDSPGPSAQPSSQGFECADLGPRASLGSLSITHRGIRRRVWILGPRASLGHPSIIAHQQLEGWAESFSLGSPSFIAHRQF
jgi:hypothetical protein